MQRIPFNLLTNVRSIPTLQQVLVSRAMGDWRASNKGCSSRSFTPSVSHRDTPSKHRSSPSKHRSSSKMGSSGDATRKQAEEEDRKAASLAALESSSVSAQEPAASYSASISSPLPPEYLHIPQPTSKPSAPSSSPPPPGRGRQQLGSTIHKKQVRAWEPPDYVFSLFGTHWMGGLARPRPVPAANATLAYWAALLKETPDVNDRERYPQVSNLMWGKAGWPVRPFMQPNSFKMATFAMAVSDVAVVLVLFPYMSHIW